MARWHQMERGQSLPLHSTRRREIEEWAQGIGYDENEIAKIIERAQDAPTYLNNLYVATLHEVTVPDSWPPMTQISVRRIDRKTVRDWRHLQRIKNDIFGPDHEAVELYPAEARVVDTANSYHLFVLNEPGIRFPFGWESGLRSDVSAASLPNQQRPGAHTR